METKSYSLILEAVSPVAHHEGSEGNQSVFMRRKVKQPDGSWVRVPYITGDTMRHGLRESAAFTFLDAAGLLHEQALGEAATRLLFSGGMITGRGDAGKLDLTRYRQLCELCPPLALLGGCTDNRSIPGRLFVDEATLICEENRRYLPDWVMAWLQKETGTTLDTHRVMLEEVQRVRMDPMLDPGKRALMPPEAQTEISRRLASSEEAHTQDNALLREDSKSTMMPRRFERLAVGSLFNWRVTCQCMSDLDADTFHVMLGGFLSHCVVGGKKATGHGQLRCLAAQEGLIARPTESAKTIDVSTDLGPRLGSLFFAHVGQRKEKIREWLKGVNS